MCRENFSIWSQSKHSRRAGPAMERNHMIFAGIPLSTFTSSLAIVRESVTPFSNHIFRRFAPRVRAAG